MTNAQRTEHDELIALARRGDRDAFGELYQLLKTAVWRWAYRALQDPVAAEEVVGDCFVAMIDQCHDLPDELPALAAWLRRVAHNKSCDWIRRNQSRRKGLQILRSTSEVQAVVSAHDSVTAAETSEQIYDALDLLPDDYQIVIQWRYLDDLRVDEIATRLGQTSSAANSLLYRARVKLRAILSQSLDEYPGQHRASSTGGRSE